MRIKVLVNTIFFASICTNASAGWLWKCIDLLLLENNSIVIYFSYRMKLFYILFYFFCVYKLTHEVHRKKKIIKLN